MSFILPSLPYSHDALEPYISKNTLSYHYDKHHQTYINNLNKLIKDHNQLNNKSLEDIIIISAQDKTKLAIFNNAAQVWNHSFYWQCMKPQGGGEPPEHVNGYIKQNFGSFIEFKKQFSEAAISQFGSGWAWLVLKESKLHIIKTNNADLPMTSGAKALLTCDVWEHAYYLDYQNNRSNYVETFINHLVNWDFVSSNLDLG